MQKKVKKTNTKPKKKLTKQQKTDKEVKQLAKEGYGSPTPKKYLTGLTYCLSNIWGDFFIDDEGSLYRLCWDSEHRTPVLDVVPHAK